MLCMLYYRNMVRLRATCFSALTHFAASDIISEVTYNMPSIVMNQFSTAELTD